MFDPAPLGRGPRRTADVWGSPACCLSLEPAGPPFETLGCQARDPSDSDFSQGGSSRPAVLRSRLLASFPPEFSGLPHPQAAILGAWSGGSVSSLSPLASVSRPHPLCADPRHVWPAGVGGRQEVWVPEGTSFPQVFGCCRPLEILSNSQGCVPF